MDDHWIETYTGKRFWPLAPRVEDICIEDIAHALAMKCRFTGHCREFYSVAQHCIVMTGLVSAPHKIWALMHDAAEAYLPDVARPIKGELYVLGADPRSKWEYGSFRVMEDNLLRLVAEKFNLDWPMPSEIAQADLRMLWNERRELMAPMAEPWPGLPLEMKPLVRFRPCLQPLAAKDFFLMRFHELIGM